MLYGTIWYLYNLLFLSWDILQLGTFSISLACFRSLSVRLYEICISQFNIQITARYYYINSTYSYRIKYLSIPTQHFFLLGILRYFKLTEILGNDYLISFKNALNSNIRKLTISVLGSTIDQIINTILRVQLLQYKIVVVLTNSQQLATLTLISSSNHILSYQE